MKCTITEEPVFRLVSSLIIILEGKANRKQMCFKKQDVLNQS